MSQGSDHPQEHTIPVFDDENGGEYEDSGGGGGGGVEFELEDIAHFEHILRVVGGGYNSTEIPIEHLGAAIRLSGVCISRRDEMRLRGYIGKDTFRLGDFLDVMSLCIQKLSIVEQVLEAGVDVDSVDWDVMPAVLYSDVRNADELKAENPSVLSPQDKVDFLMACFGMLDNEGKGYIQVKDLKRILLGHGANEEENGGAATENEVMEVLESQGIRPDDRISPSQFMGLFENVLTIAVPQQDTRHFLSQLYDSMK